MEKGSREIKEIRKEWEGEQRREDKGRKREMREKQVREEEEEREGNIEAKSKN